MASSRPRRSDPVSYVEVAEESDSELSDTKEDQESDDEDDEDGSESAEFKRRSSSKATEDSISSNKRGGGVKPKVESDSDDEYGKRKRKKKLKPKRVRISRKETQSPEPMMLSMDYFMEMPLDIFVEICSHLRPADLFRLSSVSKDLHALLVNPANQSTWFAARTNAGLAKLPDCPSMSELQYAALLYSTHCFGCGDGTSTLDLQFKTRWCDQCRKKFLIDDNTLKELNYHPKTQKCATLSSSSVSLEMYPSYYGEDWILKTDAKRFSDKLYDLRQKDVSAEKRTLLPRLVKEDGPKKAVSFVKLFVKKRSGKLMETRKSISEIESRLPEIATVSRREEIRCRQQYSISNQHRLAIEYKLNELDGWTQKDFDDSEWRYSDLVRQDKTFNEKGWTKLLPQLVRLRDKNRADREAEAIKSDGLARKNIIRTAYKTLKSTAAGDLPPCNYFAHLDHVLPFWHPDELPDDPEPEEERALDAEEPSQDKSPNKHITFAQSKWEQALEDIEEEALQYSLDDRARAVQAILRASADDEVSDDLSTFTKAEYPDSFFLPIPSYFFCPYRRCRTYYPRPYPPSTTPRFFGTYPDLLDHLSSYHDHWEDFEKSPDPSSGFSSAASRSVRGIMSMAGLDPDTATLVDLNDESFSHFFWANGPRATKEYHWFDLICEIHDRSLLKKGLPESLDVSNTCFADEDVASDEEMPKEEEVGEEEIVVKEEEMSE